MTKILLLTIGVMFAAVLSHAQEPTERHPVAIGDTIPDAILNHILNYKDSTARLSNFNGKLVILDFFATWCGSCIAALPKLDSLQNILKEQMQILVVTKQSAKKIKNFFSNNPKVHSISLPFVVDDSILNRYFPHYWIPHEVWVNRKGKVAAITEAYYITKKNILRLLSEGHLDVPIKKDILNYSIEKPILTYFKNQSRPFYTSTFGRNISGLPSRIGISIEKKEIRFYATNSSIISLYRNAIPKRLNNRIILNINDSSQFFYTSKIKYDQWASQNCFCYEFKAPKNISDQQFHSLLVNDLNSYLKLNGHKEKIYVNCWALVKTRKKASFKSKGGEPKVVYRSGLVVYQNEPLDNFLNAINLQVPGGLRVPKSPIVINETNYTGLIDLNLKINSIYNIGEIKKALQPYGLDLIPVKRKLTMFVISDEKPLIPGS